MLAEAAIDVFTLSARRAGAIYSPAPHRAAARLRLFENKSVHTVPLWSSLIGLSGGLFLWDDFKAPQSGQFAYNKKY